MTTLYWPNGNKEMEKYSEFTPYRLVIRRFWYESGEICVEEYSVRNMYAYRNWHRSGRIWSENYTIDGAKCTLDEFRDLAKNWAIYEAMRPICHLIRDLIWHHYCIC
jgi:hypothetical protein